MDNNVIEVLLQNLNEWADRARNKNGGEAQSSSTDELLALIEKAKSYFK